jgi:A118 family predicted phage portal protein
MIHIKQPDGGYQIINKFFECGGGDQITEIPVPSNIQESYRTQTARFAIVRPNIANNLTNSPLGLSVYANHLDVLRSIDLAYDGIKTSMEIGRPRIGVSNTMLQVDVNSGELSPVFDANDIAVYDMGGGGKDAAVDVKDLTTPYRAKDFEQSLQTQLDIYSQAIGLGDKAFKWQLESVATATQVVSENSAMLRSMEKHQDSIRVAITQLCRAVLDIRGLNPEQDVTVAFDDSVTRDKDAERLRFWSFVQAGKYPFWQYLTRYEGYDEAEAKALEAEATAAAQLEYEDEGNADA